MLYQIVKIICRFCLKLYYSKIEVQGLSELPKDKPILLACNHPTGFLEPVIIACVLDRPLHFITRGDLFSNKLLGPLLRATNQIPIWRFQDGYTGMKQNQKSLAAAQKALQGGGALLMFVEGKTEDVKMLKPLKKGMARISTSLQEQQVEHYIIPVAINFLDSVTWRSRVMLNFNKAIDPQAITANNEGERKSHVEINKKISAGIKSQMLHCQDRSRHTLHDELLWLAQARVSYNYSPIVEKNKSNFNYFKSVSEALDNANDEQIEQVKMLLTEIPEHQRTNKVLHKGKASLLHWLLLILLFPLGIIGFCVNIIPIILGRLTESELVESREFVAPIRYAATMGFALLWYIGFLCWSIYMCGILGISVLVGILLFYTFTYVVFLYRNINGKYGLSDESNEILVAIFTLLKIDTKEIA